MMLAGKPKLPNQHIVNEHLSKELKQLCDAHEITPRKISERPLEFLELIANSKILQRVIELGWPIDELWMLRFRQVYLRLIDHLESITKTPLNHSMKVESSLNEQIRDFISKFEKYHERRQHLKRILY